MDMSDLTSSKRSGDGAAALAVPASDPAPWCGLITQIGREIAGPLTAALERVTELTTTGRIDRQGLRALRNEIESARHAGMVSQQLSRFASGRISQAQERLHLTQTLQSVLTHRSRETQARGIQVKQVMRPVEVIVDPSLLFSLLNTLLDWVLESAQSNIEIRLDLKPWPQQGRITCRFAHQQVDLADGLPREAETPGLDSLTWHLLEQTARTMGLDLSRKTEAAQVALTLEFPRTVVNEELPGVSAVELDSGFSSTFNSRPMAGSHVLVVASRRDVRIQIREAIRSMGLVLDFVNSVDEAVDFCREGLPHAIIVEAVLRGERFDQLAEDIRAEVADFVFIEIVEEGASFEISGFSGTGFARVGRDAIMSSLPSALVFELSKGA